MMRSSDQVFVLQTKHDGALDDQTSVLSRVRPFLVIFYRGQEPEERAF